MDLKLVCLCVLILSFNLVCGQYSSSPCPGIFDFENDGRNVYGKIILRPTSPVSSLVLKISFTVAAQLYNNYVGRLEAQDSNHLLQRYNRGQPVSYIVHFPITSPLPKLTALTVNGETICYGQGDVSRPNTYVTTLSLQHTSFLQGGGPIYNSIQPQQHRPQPRPPPPQPTVDQIFYGDDDATAHIYTFNNVEPSWNNGNSPYYEVNNTRPFTQATQQYQPPTQQYQPPTQQIFHSNPIYEYDQNVPQQVTSRRPNPPPYEQATKRPTYTPPPTSPNRNEFYYPTPEPIQPAVNNDQRYNVENTGDMCGEVAGGNERVPLIYNGRSYARGDILWLVAIYKSEAANLQFICGGTLVSDRHIVTAAHCMQRRGVQTNIKDIVVKIGVHNLNDWSDDITVTRSLMAASIHESFNLATLQNDILMFTLNKRVKFNTYIRPACLWGDDTDQSRIVGASGVVAGWGDQGVGGIGKQGEPHMVRIPIVSTTDCRASKPHFHKLTYDSTLCAGDRNGAGPCVGDSGGGLYLLEGGKWRLRGVVSVSLRAENGDNTCNLNEYIIFTDTAKYLGWIRRILSEKYYD